MGSDEGLPNEKPLREIYLEAYEACVEAWAYRIPLNKDYDNQWFNWGWGAREGSASCRANGSRFLMYLFLHLFFVFLMCGCSGSYSEIYNEDSNLMSFDFLPECESKHCDEFKMEGVNDIIHLRLSNCNSNTMKKIGAIDVDVVHLTSCDLIDFNGLLKIKNLKKIIIMGSRISDFESISELMNLESITIVFSEMHSFPKFKRGNKIKKIKIIGCNLKDINGVYSLELLEDIDISMNEVSGVDDLAKINTLVRVNISGTNVWDIRSLKEIKSLSEINISATPIDRGELFSIFGGKVKIIDELIILRK